ncbi:hypothetical protein G6F57_017589 [Rhizopus arrhizus]|nr:hypothetical protein G6F57_017589 [Rhizopus arrhizus]
MHESGEWISDTLVMPLPKQDPQGYGSAMPYARRYALAAITGVYQDDDDGNAASGPVTRPTQAQNDAAPVESQATEADAMIVAQMNAAATVPDLVKLMNGLAADQKRLVTQHFNQRMSELKQAATKEGTEWVRVTAFGKLAEICGEYLKKGKQVFIEGRMQTREYEKDGSKRYVTEIVADQMQMLGSKDSQ